MHLFLNGEKKFIHVHLCSWMPCLFTLSAAVGLETLPLLGSITGFR